MWSIRESPVDRSGVIAPSPGASTVAMASTQCWEVGVVHWSEHKGKNENLRTGKDLIDQEHTYVRPSEKDKVHHFGPINQNKSKSKLTIQKQMFKLNHSQELKGWAEHRMYQYKVWINLCSQYKSFHSAKSAQTVQDITDANSRIHTTKMLITLLGCPHYDQCRSRHKKATKGSSMLKNSCRSTTCFTSGLQFS